MPLRAWLHLSVRLPATTLMTAAATKPPGSAAQRRPGPAPARPTTILRRNRKFAFSLLCGRMGLGRRDQLRQLGGRVPTVRLLMSRGPARLALIAGQTW